MKPLVKKEQLDRLQEKVEKACDLQIKGLEVDIKKELKDIMQTHRERNEKMGKEIKERYDKVSKKLKNAEIDAN